MEQGGRGAGTFMALLCNEDAAYSFQYGAERAARKGVCANKRYPGTCSTDTSLVTYSKQRYHHHHQQQQQQQQHMQHKRVRNVCIGFIQTPAIILCTPRLYKINSREEVENLDHFVVLITACRVQAAGPTLKPTKGSL